MFKKKLTCLSVFQKFENCKTKKRKTSKKNNNNKAIGQTFIFRTIYMFQLYFLEEVEKKVKKKYWVWTYFLFTLKRGSSKE